MPDACKNLALTYSVPNSYNIVLAQAADAFRLDIFYEYICYLPRFAPGFGGYFLKPVAVSLYVIALVLTCSLPML